MLSPVSKNLKASLVLSFFVLWLALDALAGTFTAFGPKSYQRDQGPPVAVKSTFTVLNPSTPYRLQVYNGGMTDGEFEKVAKSVILLNGVSVFGPTEFNQSVGFIEKEVTLQATNEISVELRGRSGGGITLVIVGDDSDLPVIIATAKPSPNSAGWNDSNVTVEFACSDPTSGVANCPAPVSLTSEGSNQKVTGTATDLAGNSASASLVINLDKTPPTLLNTSPGEGATLATRTLTLTGSVSDSLSGVGEVLCNGTPAFLSSGSFSCDLSLNEGVNTISLQVKDIAENSASFPLAFTVRTAPNVQSLSPSAGRVGDAVIINGANFGPTQGTSTVTFNGVTAAVSSWNDKVIVASVPAGAATGPVIVTVSGTASNAQSFDVITAPPAITAVSPLSGGIGQLVTLTGTYFGQTQGSSAVNFNGIVAAPQSWGDSSVTVSVPVGLSPGTASIAVTVAGLASNAVTFTVTQPLFISPNEMTLLLGEERELQVLDENGAVVNNLSWNVQENSVGIVEEPVNPGDPIVLRAIGVGTSAFSVASGNRTGQAQLTVLAGIALPVGTVRWKLPSLGPYGISRIIQSERVDDDTPVFYIQDDGVAGGNGAICALREDGQQKWIWPANGEARYPLVLAGDNFGGTIYIASNDVPNQFEGWCYLGRVDQSGIETWQYQFSNCYEDYAIHADDGTIFLLEPVFQNTASTQVTALDPNTGQIKFSLPLPQLSQSSGQNFRYDPANPTVPLCAPGATIPPSSLAEARSGSLSIDADGTVYLTLSSESVLYDAAGCDPGPDPWNPYPVNTALASWTATATLHLMKIRLDGSYTLQTLDSRTNSGVNWSGAAAARFSRPGRAIPDGQGGVLLAQARALYRASTSGVTKFTLPIDAAIPFYNTPLLVGEDGTAYLVGSSSYTSPNDRILAVDPASGTIQWSVSTNRANLNLVTTDGKVVFEYSQPDFTRHVAVADATGQVSPVLSIAGSPDPAFRGYTFSNPDYWDSGLWNVPLPNGALAGIQGEERDASDFDTFAVAGGDKQKKYQEPKGVEFKPDPLALDAESAECTGFDETLKPRWLMTPENGSNTVLLTVRRGWENIELRPQDLQVAQVSPTRIQPGDGFTTLDQKGRTTTKLTVSGGSMLQPTEIEAVDFVKNKRKALLKASVKPRLTRTLELFRVNESVETLTANDIPNAGDLRNYLDKVYGKQANIFFNVVGPQDISVHYDLDGDRRLLYTGSIDNNPEAGAILAEIQRIKNLAVPLPGPDTLWMNYVHEIRPPSLGLSSPQSRVGGFTSPRRGFIEDLQNTGLTADDMIWRTAHESGHGLAIRENTSNPRHLMYETQTLSGARPCQIPRKHWKVINPTPNDDARSK